MVLISLFPNKNSGSTGGLSLDDYIGYIRNGYNQDDVIKGRMLKQRGDEEGYKKIKNATKAVTISCFVEQGKTHAGSNIKGLTGYICVDIDGVPTDEQFNDLKNDEFTHVIHRSFGEDGIAVIVRIDPEKFDHSYLGLSEYYFDKYGVIVDPACSNRNRLRYISYDPEIYCNSKSKRFIPKDVKRFKEPKGMVNYIFHQDSFDEIMQQIGSGRVDLAHDDYFRWVRIGMSLASHFGLDGLDKFLFVSSMGSKYKEEDARKHYVGFCKRSQGKSTIGTFLYLCKEEGIKIYNAKGIKIFDKVRVGKAQGSPSLDTIASNMRAANDIEINEGDAELINKLLDGASIPKDVDEGKKNIEILRDFIRDVYEPHEDLISKKKYLKGKEVKTKDLEEMYLICTARMDFPVAKSDVRSIMNSYTVREVNALHEFLEENKDFYNEGVIEELVRCIEPYNDYNLWAFKKWLVGMVYNWMNYDNPHSLVSPLTLILVGGQGSGKTEFFRRLLPTPLKGYAIEQKLVGADKDSVFRLCSCLLFNMNDFGEKSFKDAAEFKSLSDSKFIVQRRPYMEVDETFLRIAGLCGSSNENDVLKDHTGNRRLLPVKVEKIDHARVNAIDRTALFMEVYNLYKEDFEWGIYTDEDIAYLEANTLDNKIEMPVEDIFLESFRFEAVEGFGRETFWSQGALLRHLNQDNSFTVTRFDLKDILVKHKAKNELHKRDGKVVRGYRLFMKDNPRF